MFTGLIQALGTLQTQGSDRLILTLKESKNSVLDDLEIGDSVAVDGVCLTVEQIQANGFIATASPETLQRTTLDRLNPTADLVNIETSLRVGSKLGGHFVTGHVDGIGALVKSVQTERAWEITFAAPPELSDQWQAHIARYLIQKGSIAVNGISLTVADWGDRGSWFKVAVIPHTYQQTNLHCIKPGNWVNLEGDILGKYVDRLLQFNQSQAIPDAETINLSFLAEHGYL